MNKKISLGAAVALILIIAAATFSITMVYARQSFNTTMLNIKEREATYSKLSEIDKLVRQNYFGTIETNKLMDSIAKGYVSETGMADPYARYYTVEEYAKIDNTGAAKAVGIGMVTTFDESGYIRVAEVYPDSPALAAGIAAGDLIVRIGEIDVTKDNVEAMNTSLLGEAGTRVDLIVRRDKVDSPRSATRRDVEKPSVYASLTSDKIGFVQIVEFNSNTSDQFNRSVDKLVSEGASALVFDVRNNQGSTVDSVTRILDKLLPQGTIVSASYKDGTSKVLATSDPAYINLPMMVLINEKTSSGAELFAQALKDYDMARLVGVNTIGKGTIQELFQLTDGSAISITTAKYNPPKFPESPNFDGIGVKPDYEVKLTKEQNDLVAATLLASSDAVTQMCETDLQLKKALELASTAAKTAAAEQAALAGASDSSGASSGASSSQAPSSSASSAPSSSSSAPQNDEGISPDGEEDTSSDSEEGGSSGEEGGSSGEEGGSSGEEGSSSGEEGGSSGEESGSSGEEGGSSDEE